MTKDTTVATAGTIDEKAIKTRSGKVGTGAKRRKLD